MSEDRARKAIDLFLEDNPDFAAYSHSKDRVDQFIGDMIGRHSDDLKTLIAKEDTRGPELIRRIRDLGLTPVSVNFIDHGRKIEIVHKKGDQKQRTVISAYETDDVVIDCVKSTAGME